MSSINISWRNDGKRIPKDAHALFGASKYHWLRYDIDKMIRIYSSVNAQKIGTQLHEAAKILIDNKVIMDDRQKTTFNMYVNDCIFYDMRTEQPLYYSDIFFGTADAIGCQDNILRVFDFKSGKVTAHMDQLKIYVAYFLLIYDLVPSDFDDIIMRIYQNDEINECHAQSEDIVPIMDKIVTVNDIVQRMKENQ